MCNWCTTVQNDALWPRIIRHYDNTIKGGHKSTFIYRSSRKQDMHKLIAVGHTANSVAVYRTFLGIVISWFWTKVMRLKRNGRRLLFELVFKPTTSSIFIIQPCCIDVYVCCHIKKNGELPVRQILKIRILPGFPWKPTWHLENWSAVTLTWPKEVCEQLPEWQRTLQMYMYNRNLHNDRPCPMTKA